MFSNPLSFNGRIGRLEYFISFVVFWVFAIGLYVLANQENFNFLSLIKLIVSYFFVAQGAKRCHDIGRSGWFQLIPFFFIWMLIAKENEGRNSIIKKQERNQMKSALELNDKKNLKASELIEKYKSK